MKRLFLIFGLLLFAPSLAFGSNNAVEIAILVVLHLIVIIPYYVFALIPYYIQQKYNGRSAFFSILTYALCIVAITLAYYQEFRFIIPNKVNGDDIDFFLRVLPFIIIIILTASKNYKYNKTGIA